MRFLILTRIMQVIIYYHAVFGFFKPVVRVAESKKQVEHLEMLESAAGFSSLQTS
jgi:hypothetical protein